MSGYYGIGFLGSQLPDSMAYAVPALNVQMTADEVIE
jgi:hypothetical protein